MLSHVEEKVETFGPPTRVWLQFQAHQSARPLILDGKLYVVQKPANISTLHGWMDGKVEVGVMKQGRFAEGRRG